MTEKDRRRLTKRAALLKSLAHPARLLILELLEQGPRCVTELTEAVGSDITTVSKHLAIMRRAGLVRDVKRGTYSEYSLVCDCVTHLVDCIEGGMEDQSGNPSTLAKPRKPGKACRALRKDA